MGLATGALLALLTLLPTTLVSVISREQCTVQGCRTLPPPRGLQSIPVKTYSSADECEQIRGLMMQKKDQAMAQVNATAQAASPRSYLRTDMRFTCQVGAGGAGGTR